MNCLKSLEYFVATSAPIRYARCKSGPDVGPLLGVRRTGADSTRRPWTDLGWACVGGVPTGEIRPGDGVTVTVRVGAYDQPTMSPLPQALRQSNAFDVRCRSRR
jgi:hypothetical protein